jgi:DNA-binding transcriptional MerR regulator
MKPEFRSLDPLGWGTGTSETLATLIATPVAADGRLWTIGELARECAVTLRALRFYEGKGLLAPRRDGTARLYGAAEVWRLKVILRLKRIGFSLIAIREMLEIALSGGDVAERKALLRRRIERQVEVLELQRDEAVAALAAIDEELAALTVGVGQSA